MANIRRVSTIRESKKRVMLRRKQKMVFAGGLVCLILVIWAMISISHWNYVRNADKTVIGTNVYIGDVDVSGMTKKRAKKAVTATVSTYAGQSLNLKVKGKKAKTTLKELGLQVKNVETVVQEAMDYGKKGSVGSKYQQLKGLEKKEKKFKLSYNVTKKTAAPTLLALCAPLETPATNASIDYDGTEVSVVKGKEGVNIDVNACIASINTYLETKWKGKAGGTVKMTSAKESPSISADDLKDVTDLLGSYQTYYGEDGSGRVQNIKMGSSYINGTLLQPGEEFSTDALMRPYTTERGYEPAGSYESGKVVDTMGGGICQISTTLYNAVLYAELKVTERYPHSMMVSYVDPSRDAAIADDTMDFKFKNSEKYPIYISCTAEDGYLSFYIFGKETRDPNRTVDFESETLNTTDYDTVYAASEDDSIGSMYTANAGHEGGDAQLWKIVTVDGEEESRDVINTSHYEALDETINIGVSSSNSSAIAVIENAITSQNADTIQMAISSALALGSGSSSGTQ